MRVILVYDADGGLRGELSYVLGKLRGTARCALCDITHGPLGPRRAWRERCARLGVRVDALHRDELDAAQREACRAGRAAAAYPCVLLEPVEGETQLLLDPCRIEACDGPDALYHAIRGAARERGVDLGG